MLQGNKIRSNPESKQEQYEEDDDIVKKPNEIEKGGDPIETQPPIPPLIDGMHKTDKEGLRLRLQHAQQTYRQFAKDEKFVLSRTVKFRQAKRWLPLRKCLTLIFCAILIALILFMLIIFANSESMLRIIEKEEDEKSLTATVTICPILMRKTNDFIMVNDKHSSKLYGYLPLEKAATDFTPDQVIKACTDCGSGHGSWKQVKSSLHGFCLQNTMQEMVQVETKHPKRYDGFIVYVHQKSTEPHVHPISGERNFFRARAGYSTSASVRRVELSRLYTEVKCAKPNEQMGECLATNFHDLVSRETKCYVPTVHAAKYSECVRQHTSVRKAADSIVKTTLPRLTKCTRDCTDQYFQIMNRDQTLFVPSSATKITFKNIAEIKVFPYGKKKVVIYTASWSIYSIIAWIGILLAFFLNISLLHFCGFIHTTCYLLFYRKQTRYSRIQCQLVKGLERLAERRLWIRRDYKKPIIRQADIGRVRNLVMLYNKYYGMEVAERSTYTNMMNLRLLCTQGQKRKRKATYIAFPKTIPKDAEANQLPNKGETEV